MIFLAYNISLFSLCSLLYILYHFLGCDIIPFFSFLFFSSLHCQGIHVLISLRIFLFLKKIEALLKLYSVKDLLLSHFFIKKHLKVSTSSNKQICLIF